MKKIIRFYFILTLFIFTISCNETQIVQSENSETTEFINTNGIYYPLSNYSDFSTRSTTLSDNWEEWSTVTLPSGEIKNVPWSSELVSTSIPPDIRKDIKKEDGWELIAHTLNMPDVGANYLFFIISLQAY